MCLVSGRRDDDVVIAPRRAQHRDVVWADGHRGSRTRVSERIITTHAATPPKLIAYPTSSPRTSGALVRSVTPPRRVITPAERERIDLVSVDIAETRKTVTASPRGSRVSVRRGGADEVYIEREREMVRMPQQKRDEYDTYRYVEAPDQRRGSRSITYETNPRLSGRLVERERVVVEQGGRRREYYRKT